MADKDLAVIDVRAQTLPAPVVNLQQWAQRRQQFNEWVNSQLKPGIDYGVIPGTDKPSLWQPGAQKIAQFYGCAPKLTVTYRDCNPATGYLYVEVTCQLVSLETGQVVGEGIGACSTYESKHRYRKEWWNGKGEPTGGEWERTRNARYFRRIENQDMADQWNTVVKIAGKRGMVAAAANISAASERFTQDLEDLVQDDPEPVRPAAPGNGHTQQAAEPAPSGHWIDEPGTLPKFWAWCKSLQGLSEQEVHAALGVQHLKDYKGSKTDAMNTLDAFSKAKAVQQ